VTFRPVARRDDVWAGEMAGLRVGSTPVLLVNLDGTLYAYEDRCPHRGVPLSRGRLQDGAIVCGAHDWTYDACTGRGINPRSAALCPLRVAVQGEEIWVELGDVRSDNDGGGGGGDAVAERVGPVLQAGPEADAVVTAIRFLNIDVQVLDRGAYLRVLVPGACHVTREAIEAELHAPFRLPADLERVMPSFKGRLSMTEDEARWEAAAPASHERPGER
jgi:toluene monooxygenase system ferredoxin subunit